jgi:hypothetical protein
MINGRCVIHACAHMCVYVYITRSAVCIGWCPLCNSQKKAKPYDTWKVWDSYACVCVCFVCVWIGVCACTDECTYVSHSKCFVCVCVCVCVCTYVYACARSYMCTHVHAGDREIQILFWFLFSPYCRCNHRSESELQHLSDLVLAQVPGIFTEAARNWSPN